jgi:hypothetical protein
LKSAVARYLVRKSLPRFKALDGEVEAVVDRVKAYLFGTVSESCQGLSQNLPADHLACSPLLLKEGEPLVDGAGSEQLAEGPR